MGLMEVRDQQDLADLADHPALREVMGQTVQTEQLDPQAHPVLLVQQDLPDQVVRRQVLEHQPLQLDL